MNRSLSKTDVCQHCVWIEDDYRKAPKWIPKMSPPVFICRPDKFTAGATVFNSSGKFSHTFNVVYGIKGSFKHSTTDIQGLLICVTRFIEYLYTEYGICQIRLVMNSAVKDFGKEHIHAWISMDSKEDEEKFDKLFGGRFRLNKPIVKKPYENDIIYNITPEEGKELIRDKAEQIISEKLNISPDDLVKHSFYLFLNFHCDGKNKIATVSGLLSIPPPPK